MNHIDFSNFQLDHELQVHKIQKTSSSKYVIGENSQKGHVITIKGHVSKSQDKSTTGAEIPHDNLLGKRVS